MPAEGAADVLVSINPATLQPLGETPITPPNKLSEIASAARAAQTTWGRLTYKERGKFLLRARRYLLDHMDDFAFTITQENGKPLVESLTAECYPIADLLYYFAHRTGTILRPYRVWTGLMDLLGRHSWIGYRPRGVIGIISPWNYPFSIPAGCAAMAIAAGNTVLLKPSSVTSLVGQKIAEMFEAAGLPDHVFNHLPGNTTTGECRAVYPLRYGAGRQGRDDRPGRCGSGAGGERRGLGGVYQRGPVLRLGGAGIRTREHRRAIYQTGGGKDGTAQTRGRHRC
ncbi:MAG: aldehyde dehydrogenase family protein [Deltaproteobacteria bacterium]|nr:aldehyde dehydrogenase family protein [Deltaproteobacteria bacterium]